MKEKIVCEVCKKKLATWIFMPCSEHIEDFYCDECVPRGCDHCNINPIDELEDEYRTPTNLITYYTVLDNNFVKCEENDAVYYELLNLDGLKQPCIEFDYEEKGFLKTEYDYETE